MYRNTALKLDPSLYFPNATDPVLHQIPGPGGPLDIYEFKPSKYRPDGPALLWIHGGGYITGHGQDRWFGALFAELAGVSVFSVDYRLAPEHPFPAARDDGLAALNWLSDNSAALRIDPKRLAIGGGSAGAGIAAGLALHIRNISGPELAFQLLLYPMLDNQHATPSGYLDVPRWTRTISLTAWEMYLGGQLPEPTSVPANADELRGLPPTYLCIGEADIFLDETRNYAERLKLAKVPCELCTYRGVFHAAEMLGYGTEIGHRMTNDYVNALKNALQVRLP